MATREELIALLSSYLTGQATNPSWYYTTSPSELETIYKDYIKSQYGTDTVTPYYRAMGDDPVAQQMFSLFGKINSGDRNAAGIIEEYESAGTPLTEEQKADLKTFESEKQARDEALLEQYVNAEIYGLPTPDASGWGITPEMLEGFQPPPQKGGMTEAQVSQRWLRDAQKKLAVAEANLKKVPGGGQTTLSGKMIVGERTDPASWLWNRTLGSIIPGGKIQEKKPVQRDREDATDAQRKAMMERNTAYTMKRAAEMQARQDSTFTQRLADEIAKQMVAKYGTPYEAAIITARRLAEEEAAKKYGPAPSGSSALSEWDREQERKRQLIEGRGI